MTVATSQVNQNIVFRLLAWFLRRFFGLLYHQFAWTYDFVAWVVSLGQWNSWTKAVIPYLNGSMVVELGHGPGHLQAALFTIGIRSIGLDQSKQMSRQAYRRLRRIHIQPTLVNASVQQLPFSSNTIPQLVATFPSEYISNPQSLTEMYRILMPGGSGIILLSAWITGKNILERAASWLFRVTGESPIWNDNFLNPARAIGFVATSEFLMLPRSKLLLIRLQKPG